MKKRKQTKNFHSTFIKEKVKRIMAMILTFFMAISIISYGGIITAKAQGNTYDISAGTITINSSNLSTYNNAIITGTSNSNMITIDGVTANLTFSNLNLNIESSTSTIAGWYSAIKLTNGATLNLTITGDNTVTAGIQHAAINVPEGCSLVITQDSTGTLTATAGNGSAGIGADYGGTGDYNIKTVGNITINGGTVKAYGSGGGAGIGGTSFGKTGNIVINGGTVNAKGGGGILKNPFFQATCGAGIGGGSDGYVQNITITGGNVIAIGGHYHMDGFNMKDYPAAGIGCGSETGVTSDGKYTCGIISITGGAICATGGNNNAVNAIGYGLSPNFDISGDNFIGSVTISDNASVNTNGGAIHPLSNTGSLNMYKLAMTIYDGRLAKTIEGATIKVNGRTYLSDIKVNENYVGSIYCSLICNAVLTGEQTVEISAGGYSWITTVNFTENNFDYTTVIGSKLYPVYLWFYDAAIASDISGVSLAVKQNGKLLNSNAAEGMVQLVCDGTITKYKAGVGKMTAYMLPESSELTATVPGVNGGNAITVSGKTIKASPDGTIIILWDTYTTAQLSSTLDLSYGNITFADNGGKLDITYTPENGGAATTVTGQYYQNEYEIIQSNSTVTTNKIIFQNTTDFVNVKLNGVNMKSTGKAIDLQKAKAKLSLSGTNTIDCGGGSDGDAGYYIGIHAASGSELTIDGSGSLEVKNPSSYGVGIGGYFHYRSGLYEGAGTIRIQGGTLNVSGKNGTAIGSCYFYKENDFGSIYITGGTVDASSNDSGAAIGGSDAGKPANVYITGGKVTAKTEGWFGGAAIGSGSSGVSGGKVVISGGYVEATATKSANISAIGGGHGGICPDITISGGTIKASGSVASIGTAKDGTGGSLKITGGTICTINNGKPTINLTPTKDGTTPVYYTTAYVGGIYGKDASVNNASITGYDYGFTDVKTDTNGALHLYLPASPAGTETKASFKDVNYSGNITSGDSNVLQKPNSGAGTQADPYIIETADDLAVLANSVRTGQNYSGKYFKLNNDINYSSMPIGCYFGDSVTNSPFCGNFDGAGHTVTLAMTNDSSGMKQAVALFGYLGSGAVVENIITTGTITSLGKFSGGIAGVARDGVVNISNCSSNVEMNFTTGGDSTYGGIVGLINNSGNVTMTNCCFTGKITSSGTKLEGVGGLCGWNSDKLNAINCYVDASFGSSSITAKGEYISRNGGTFTNCYYNKENKLTDDGSTNSTGTEAMTSDFTSGKVTWLLQNGQSNSDVQAWGQTLTADTKDSDPVLSSDSAKAVHKVSYYQDNKELENIRGYVNSSMTLPNFTLTEEEINEGYKYNFEITSGIAALDTANNQLKDIGGDVSVTVKKEISVAKANGSITIKDDYKVSYPYTGNTIAEPTESQIDKLGDGKVTFEWYDGKNEDGTVTGLTKRNTAPVEVGNYTLKGIVGESTNYKAAYTAVLVTIMDEQLGMISIIVDEGTSYIINSSEYTASNTGTYSLGTNVTVAVTDAKDFAYWVNDYGKIVSRKASYTFTVTGSMNLTAVYNKKVENKSTVIFESYYGQVMSRTQLGSDDAVALPDGPTRYGYTFIKWSMTAEEIQNQISAGTAVIKVIPVYELINQSYTIMITDGAGSGNYKLNDLVTATAKAPEVGMKFSHWTDENNNILSYSTTYQFYATKDVTIIANYVANATVVEAKGTAEIIDINKDTEKSKIIFVSMVTVPEGCKIQMAGVIGTDNKTVGISGDGFNKNTAAYVRGNEWTGNAYRFTWTKKVTTDQTWYVRAYLVYKDTNGNLVTVYGDMISAGLNN